MIGIGFMGLALTLFFIQVMEMVQNSARHREVMEAVRPEIEITWLRRPEKYQRIEADWERITKETALTKGKRK